MRTVNGTKVKPLRAAGVGDTGCAQCLYCLAHPDDKSRGFVVMVAVDDIEGGAEAVREFLRTGVDPDMPPARTAPPAEPPRETPKRQAVDDFGDL